MTIGDRIKQCREALSITQTALADIVGTTKQNIYKYENGIITNIPSDRVKAIAAALNTTPTYLMGWEDALSHVHEESSADRYAADLRIMDNKTEMSYMTEESMAKRIRKLRLEQGLTLEQVANKVGVGKSAVRKWETGIIANMRWDKIVALANALQTTPTYLMGLNELVVSENCYQIVLAYLRADAPIKKIVDTALQPYFTNEPPQ